MVTLFDRFVMRLQNLLLNSKTFVHIVHASSNIEATKYMKKSWAKTDGIIITAANEARNGLQKGATPNADRIFNEAVKLAGEKYPERLSVDRFVLEDGTTVIHVTAYKPKKAAKDEPVQSIMPE